jgi:hypothetical protein
MGELRTLNNIEKEHEHEHDIEVLDQYDSYYLVRCKDKDCDYEELIIHEEDTKDE